MLWLYKHTRCIGFCLFETSVILQADAPSFVTNCKQSCVTAMHNRHINWHCHAETKQIIFSQCFARNNCLRNSAKRFHENHHVMCASPPLLAYHKSLLPWWDGYVHDWFNSVFRVVILSFRVILLYGSSYATRTWSYVIQNQRCS